MGCYPEVRINAHMEIFTTRAGPRREVKTRYEGIGAIESISALNDISLSWELLSRLLSSQVNNKLPRS